MKQVTSGVVVGSSGGGKSVTSLSIAVQAIEAGDPVLYVDCKGDEQSAARVLEHAAKKHGREFCYVSTEAEPSHLWNPVESLAEVAEWTGSFSSMLAKSLGLGANLGHSYFTDEAAATLDAAISSDRSASTFARLFELLNDPDNKSCYPSKKRWDDTSSLRSILRAFSEVPQFNQSSFDPSVSAEQKASAVDLRRLIENGGVLYVRARRFHALVPTLVRTIYETVRAARTDCAEKRRTVLVCDELHRALEGTGASLFTEVISLARAVGLVPFFVFQAWSQIVSAGGIPLRDELLEIPAQFFFGANGRRYQQGRSS